MKPKALKINPAIRYTLIYFVIDSGTVIVSCVIE